MSCKSQKNFAFIDSQNLNLAIRAQGWKLISVVSGQGSVVRIFVDHWPLVTDH